MVDLDAYVAELVLCKVIFLELWASLALSSGSSSESNLEHFSPYRPLTAYFIFVTYFLSSPSHDPTDDKPTKLQNQMSAISSPDRIFQSRYLQSIRSENPSIGHQTQKNTKPLSAKHPLSASFMIVTYILSSTIHDPSDEKPKNTRKMSANRPLTA